MSEQRRYTIDEIDRMRQALRWRETPIEQAYYPTERDARVEDMLRTYMAAGVDPDGLVKSCDWRGSSDPA